MASRSKAPAKTDDAYLPYRAVRERYGYPSKSTLHRWIGDGEFPEPAMRIGRRRYWSFNELARHDTARMKRGVETPEPERLRRSR